MYDMSVTDETFHDDKSPLKESALANIYDMSVAEEVFHLERSSLNVLKKDELTFSFNAL
jgi:hypothetical protein